MQISLGESNDIALSVVERQSRFPSETVYTSVMVVLCNYEDRNTPVHCINGEWSGIKADLLPVGSIPTCPNGHVLLEG